MQLYHVPSLKLPSLKRRLRANSGLDLKALKAYFKDLASSGEALADLLLLVLVELCWLLGLGWALVREVGIALG